MHTREQNADFFTTIEKKLTPEKREILLEAYKKKLQESLFSAILLDDLIKEGFFQEGAENLADVITYLHNAGLWERHLREGNSLKNLKIHTLWTFEKKRAEEEFLKKIPKYLAWMLVRCWIQLKYNPEFNTMSEAEELAIQQSLQEVLAGKNTFIITNHDTFSNIPVIIMKYMVVARTLKIKNPNQYLYTILGPLLMTHKRQKLFINMLSNIIITQPADDTPEPLKEAYTLQRNLAGEKIRSDFWIIQNDATTTKTTEVWKIYLCAPSGTRDIVLRLKDGKPMIYLPDESHISNRTTYPLTKEIKKSGARILLLGTNTTALKKGKVFSNNDRNKNAKVELHLKEIEDPEQLNTKNAIQELQSLVTQEGETVAKTIPYHLFKLVKTLQKSWKLEEYLQEDGDLDLEKLEGYVAEGKA